MLVMDVRHGKTSQVRYVDYELFKGVKNPFRATRYHSLVGDKTIIPDVLEVISTANDDGEIMAKSIVFSIDQPSNFFIGTSLRHNVTRSAILSAILVQTICVG